MKVSGASFKHDSSSRIRVQQEHLGKTVEIDLSTYFILGLEEGLYLWAASQAGGGGEFQSKSQCRLATLG